MSEIVVAKACDQKVIGMDALDIRVKALSTRCMSLSSQQSHFAEWYDDRTTSVRHLVYSPPK